MPLAKLTSIIISLLKFLGIPTAIIACAVRKDRKRKKLEVIIFFLPVKRCMSLGGCRLRRVPALKIVD
jgi:hypothetical protein